MVMVKMILLIFQNLLKIILENDKIKLVGGIRLKEKINYKNYFFKNSKLKLDQKYLMINVRYRLLS